jgi:hypothetical protein
MLQIDLRPSSSSRKVQRPDVFIFKPPQDVQHPFQRPVGPAVLYEAGRSLGMSLKGSWFLPTYLTLPTPAFGIFRATP